jgi:exopolyphosphatase/guanosine-5'-triphosphate,3'-diphosphate pyrophosphatase
MREGILWDLLGRVHDHDMRDVTVNQFQRRYRVDTRQARRVESLAVGLFPAVVGHLAEDPGDAMHRLVWAARMHEIGISIAHAGLHKHGAYILENADMPGFSRRDQTRLAALVRASRGGLDKLCLGHDDPNWPLILCLRLAVLFHASRSDVPLSDIRLDCAGGSCQLRLPAAWIKANPLSQAVLDEELRDWARVAPMLRLAGIRAD